MTTGNRGAFQTAVRRFVTELCSQTAAKFIRAGAAALGIGRELIPKEALQQKQEGRIRELARRFLNFVKTARVWLEDSQDKDLQETSDWVNF